MAEVIKKVCTKCGEEKEIGEFYKRKDERYTHLYIKYTPDCKKCYNIRGKIYRNKNKNKVMERDRKYRELNKEKISERRKIYYQKNKNQIKHKVMKYYSSHKNKRDEYKKKWYEQNIERIKKLKKLYNEKNKEKIKEYTKKNIVQINSKKYNLKTVPDKAKPTIQKLIKIKNIKLELNKNREQILNIKEASNG